MPSSNDTHRKTLARRLADQTNLSYQAALDLVLAAAAAGQLPAHLDEDGMQQALTLLTTATAAPAPVTPDRSPAEPAAQPGPRVRVLRSSDLTRCPKLSMLPEHFRDDGTCRCDEQETAQAEVDAALAELHAAQARLRAARDHLRVT